MTNGHHTLIVCGASSALATSIIERVANEGMTLVATYRTRPRGDELDGRRKSLCHRTSNDERCTAAPDEAGATR
jgi:NAD(P)-dependent dehydrogenase (short-subunit alcohol dehydrogenase family)